ncbi:MAG: T9SS type A sorting domain-containing protein [Bacteroidia bacterium]|nr:T9SS type A sorting domain-containing protein [Bacteroidia bacterium]
MKLFTFFWLCIISIMGFAQTTVDRIIDSTQVWTAANSPYIIDGNTTVQSGVQIVVKPGAIIYSSNGDHQFFVEGEFIAEGKEDSLIVFDNMKMHFRSNSVEFDSSTGKGSRFDFCMFTSDRNNSLDAIRIEQRSMSVTNSTFVDVNNGLYGESGSTKSTIHLSNNTYLGVRTKGNKPVNLFGRNYWLAMTNCYMENIWQIIPGPNALVRGNTFQKVNHSGELVHLLQPREFMFWCNKVVDVRNRVFQISNPDLLSHVSIRDNHFELIPGIMEIRLAQIGDSPGIVVTNNNFIDVTNVNAIRLLGATSSLRIDTLNFRSNYWNTQNTSFIDNTIYDYHDDVDINVVVDYSNVLDEANTSCTSGSTIGASGLSSTHVPTPPDATRVFPNPTNDWVVIKDPERQLEELVVHDLAGKHVWSQEVVSTSTTLDLTNLQTGTYILMLKGRQFHRVERLIVTD